MSHASPAADHSMCDVYQIQPTPEVLENRSYGSNALETPHPHPCRVPEALAGPAPPHLLVQSQALPYHVGVVDNVVMGECGPLGAAGCPLTR